MADDIKMVIGVQYDGLLKAITATDTLEGKVKKLSGAYARGSASYSKYNKAVARLAKENNKGAKAQANARKEMLAYGSALRKTTKDEKEAKAVKAALKITEQQRVKSLREEKVAIQQKVAADARNASELKRVRMSVDAVYSAQQKRLNMKKLLKAAVVAETMSTKQAIVALKQYNAAQINSSKVMGASRNKMNGNNMAVQQLGYQMGDFAVQVQGGTSAFVAFSQQGAQLAGMLPMIAGPLGLTMGAAVGLSAALGIGIPIFSAVGRMFFEMAGGAKSLKESFESLSSINDALDGFGANFGLSLKKNIEEIRAEFGDLVADIYQAEVMAMQKSIQSSFKKGWFQESFAESYPSMTINQAVHREEDSFVALEERAKQVLQIQAALNSLYSEEIQSKSQLAEVFHESYQTLLASGALNEKGLKILQQMAKAQGIESNIIKEKNKVTKESQDLADAAAKKAAKEAQKLLELTAQISASTPYEPMSALAAEAVNSQFEMIKLFKTSADLKEEIGLAAYEALRLSGVDMASPISAASLEAAKLAGNLGIALIAAVNLANAQSAPSGAIYGGAGRNIGRGSTGVTTDYQNEQGYESIDSQIAAFNDKKARKANSGGGSSSNPVEKLRQQIELNSKLVGLSKEEATVLTQVHSIQNSLGKDRGKYSRETIVGLIEQNEAYKEQQRVIEEAKAQQDALATSMASSFGDAFTSIIDGTKSAKDAFKDMASSIIKQLFEVLVVQRLVGQVGTATSAGSGIAGFLGNLFANGGAFSGGSQVQAYANGGVVNGPTNFPMSGNKMGLMGEAGPEAIMPLKRGANGKLGVQAEGGSKGGDVINISQTFSFSANGDDSVKKIIQQQMPRITEATKSAVVDAKRRGGSYGRSFG